MDALPLVRRTSDASQPSASQSSLTHQAPRGLPQPVTRSPTTYALVPPAYPPYLDSPDSPDFSNDPPPSYEDALASESVPLLVGPPPNYGAFRAWVDSDDTSEASSEAEPDPAGRCTEWAGHAFILLAFSGIMYGLWSFIAAPPNTHVGVSG